MRKFFHFTSVLASILILCIAEAAFSQSTPVDFKYPVVPNSDMDTPFCYMQTAGGRTLNLEDLCRPQLKELVLSCPTITAPEVRDRIYQYCGNDDNCLASAGCNQPQTN